MKREVKSESESDDEKLLSKARKPAAKPTSARKVKAEPESEDEKPLAKKRGAAASARKPAVKKEKEQ